MSERMTPNEIAAHESDARRALNALTQPGFGHVSWRISPTTVRGLLDALASERMTIADLHNKAIGVVTVTPLDSLPPVLHGHTAPGLYPTPYATVQDAAQRAMNTATLCLLIPVDQDEAVL